MSKGLEAFTKVKEYLECCFGYRNHCEALQYNSTSLFLEPYIDEIEKELKALEIIKRKGIDINILEWANNCAEYNSNAKYCIGYTQEEYDLLTEVLL